MQYTSPERVYVINCYINRAEQSQSILIIAHAYVQSYDCHSNY